MAVSILNPPRGWLFSESPITGFFTKTFNDISIYKPSHGYIDGTPIYIKSRINNYNGTWYTFSIGTDFFKIKRDYYGTTYAPFIPGTDGQQMSYVTVTPNGAVSWSCVHLPIVYKVLNTLWPTNSVDSVRTMSSVTDSNGYCNITASGDIKATGSAAALEFVKITGSSNSDLNKIWQIITYSSDTSFILNIPYSAANDTALTGASIQYYYNNYNIRARVYGGLPDGHMFNSLRPYALLVELKLTPDGSNVTTFSVSDILKSQITTDNDTLLGTLPNNINNWTGFYIEYAEAYDVATAGVLVNTVGSYTSDKSNFEGYAVNAMLPFKNIYSGSMSEYVIGDSNQKFLTLFDEPVIFPGKYFDIGYIWNKLSVSNPSLSTFVNSSDTGTSWTLSATPNVTLAGTPADSKQLRAAVSGLTDSAKYYNVIVNVTLTAGATDPSIDVGFLNSSFVAVRTINQKILVGTFDYGFTIQGHASAAYLYFEAFADVGGSANYKINSYSIDENSLIFLSETTFISSIEQGTTVTEIDNFDTGVYRLQLTEPSCNHNSIDVKIVSGNEISILAPLNWTDSIGSFDSKTATQFIESVTSATGMIESYMPLSAQVGDVVKVTYTVDVTGTAVFSGQGIQVDFTLRDSGGGSAGALASPLLIAANGTYSNTSVITATATAARLAIVIQEGTGITSGTATVVITVSGTSTLITNTGISETKTIKIDCSCAMPQAEGGMVLSWLNYLGGYDHWFFTTEQEKQINILETAQTDDNIFPNWPNSYGEFARGITRQTYRKAKQRIKLTSQLCTLDQLKGLQYLKTSPVVTITNSIYDTRIIIPDQDSFTLYNQGDKQYTISFYAEFTDLIPSQRR